MFRSMSEKCRWILPAVAAVFLSISTFADQDNPKPEPSFDLTKYTELKYVSPHDALGCQSTSSGFPYSNTPSIDEFFALYTHIDRTPGNWKTRYPTCAEAIQPSHIKERTNKNAWLYDRDSIFKCVYEVNNTVTHGGHSFDAWQSTLQCLVRCETGDRFDPGELTVGSKQSHITEARRGNAQGLFQFLPSTYRSICASGDSKLAMTDAGCCSDANQILSPACNTLAAIWMIKLGRGPEWDCWHLHTKSNGHGQCGKNW